MGTSTVPASPCTRHRPSVGLVGARRWPSTGCSRLGWASPALADLAGLALARTFVVAWADAHPTGQPLGAAEGAHVRTNLHQQHRCALQVDARDGLQQVELGPVGLQALQQIRVQSRDALLDLLDVLHDLIGHEAVHGAELLCVQGLEQLLSTRPQTPLAVQHLVHGLVGDQRLDHGARAGAVNVGHHHVDAHACIHQHLVQPVLLGAAHAHQLLALARHQSQLPHQQRWNERRPQQPGPRQSGQPLRVGDVGLATGHGFDVPRVDHPRSDTHRLQRRKRALPIHARALHDHHLGPDLKSPLGQRAAVAFEGAELTHGDLHPPIVMLDDGAGRDLGLVNIQRHGALVHRGQLHT
jgi:hypothetical protein